MKIAVRLDDINPGMDLARFERFRSLLSAHGIRPLIGVVPDSRDRSLMRTKTPMTKEDFFAFVRECRDKDGWTIVMHGVTHVYTGTDGGIFPLNRQTEFAGLSVTAQKQMLAHGKRILEENGIRTDLFMAPAHSFDRATLSALKETGFTGVTDGFGRFPYERDGLVFYPIAVAKGRALKDRRDGAVTFVVHTATMTDAETAFYERLLQEKHLVSFDEVLAMKPVSRSRAGHLAEYLTARTKRFLVQRRR